MTIRRITRDRPLTPEEAAKHQKVREQIAQELPDLIARHHKRMAASDKEKGENTNYVPPGPKDPS